MWGGSKLWRPGFQSGKFWRETASRNGNNGAKSDQTLQGAAFQRNFGARIQCCAASTAQRRQKRPQEDGILTKMAFWELILGKSSDILRKKRPTITLSEGTKSQDMFK